jgi:hypothetical protein
MMKTKKLFLSNVPQSLARQRGASLLEGIAYLGIAAIVVLGAVSLLSTAFSGAKANQVTEEIISLRTAVRKLYLGQAYKDTAVEDLIAANAVPGTLGRDGSTVVNTWGGTVAIATVGGGFTITYPNLPKSICQDVVKGTNGWVSVKQGEASVAAFPATLADATTVCSEESNTLVFTAN